MLFFTFLVLLCQYNNAPFVRNGFILTFILLLICSTGWLPRHLSQYLEGQYPIIKKADHHIKWIVILSGGQAEFPNTPPNSILNSVSIDRLVEGVRLYRQIPHAKLVLSGGSSDAKISEAVNLAQVALWFDIPKEYITLETKSINTADEAKELKSIIGKEPFYLVTSAIHMPRAMALCKAQGLHPIAAPTDFSSCWNKKNLKLMLLPSPYNIYYLSVAMHEILGLIVAKLQ